MRSPNFISYLVILLLCPLSILGQIPPNDFCENAIELPITTNGCSFTPYVLDEANSSAINVCYPSLKDVWFTLTVPDGASLSIEVFHPNFALEPSISIFVGDDCGALEFYSCLEGGNNYAGLLQLILSDPNLSGQTIYLRMFSFWNDTGTFEICVQSLDLLNTNTTCETARNIPYNGEVCDPNLSITDTLRNIAAFPLFNCFLMQRDLWYELVVPAFGIVHVDIVKPNEDNVVYQLEIYRGACNALELFTCLPEQYYPAGGFLTIHNTESEDETYIIRIGSDMFGAEMELEICAREIIPAPNDICQTAIDIEHGFYPNCGPNYSLDFNTAIDEEFTDLNVCFINVKDMWYHFDDGDSISSLVMTIENTLAGNNEIIFEVLNGNSCDGLFLANCQVLNLDSPVTEFLINLQNSNDPNWYFRISSNEINISNPVDICFSIPVPESNDECIDAILLPVNAGCLDFTNFGSTNSPESFCSSNEDVWFKFMYEAEQMLQIQINHASQNFTNSYNLNIYRGSCDGLELIECNVESFSFTDLFYQIQNPELIGEMIYLSITKNQIGSTVQEFNFEICVEELNNPAAAFDYCSIAKPIPVNNPGLCAFTDLLAVGFNDYSGIGSPCHEENIGGDNWLKFIVPDNGRFVIDISVEDPIGLQTRIKSLNFYKGTCTDLELVSCFDDIDELSKRMNFSALANEQIFIQVVSNENSFLEYEICIKEFGNGPIAPNDLCGSAIDLDIMQDDCLNPHIGDNTNAFSSDVVVDCPGFQGNDVWYRFTVPESGELIIEARAKDGSTLIDGAFALYVGTCENLQLLNCDDDSGQGNMPAYRIANPIFSDAEVFMQFWSFNALQEGEFEICLIEPSNAIGDACSSAIEVNPKGQEDCFNGNDIASTFSNGYSGVVPACNSSIASDIWFKFSYLEGQKLVFDFKQAEGSLLFDGQAAIYRQGCSSLQFLACADDNGPGNMPSFDLEEIIDPAWDGNQNFYIQFWDYNQGVGGELAYCLYDKNFVSIPAPVSGSLSVNPNPFSESVRISLPDNIQGQVEWYVLDALGAKIKSGRFQADQSSQDFELNMSDVMPASYILSLKTKDGQWVEKLLKL